MVAVEAMLYFSGIRMNNNRNLLKVLNTSMCLTNTIIFSSKFTYSFEETIGCMVARISKS